MPGEDDRILRSDARDNRARILTAARALFATAGLDVPLREIARRADVGVATLYRHFPTKEALLTAAFTDQMAVCGRLVEEGSHFPDPVHALFAVLEELMAVHALDRGFAHALTAQFPHVYDFTRSRDRALRGLAELLRRAKEAGGVRPDIVLEDIVLALMASEGIRAESPHLRDRATRRFAALLLESFRTHPTRTPLPPPVQLPVPQRP